MKKLLVRLSLFFATIIIFLMAGILIIAVHLVKIFRKLIYRDPFCDSEQGSVASSE